MPQGNAEIQVLREVRIFSGTDLRQITEAQSIAKSLFRKSFTQPNARTGLRGRFPPHLGRQDQEREDRFRLLYHSERPHKRATTTAMGQNCDF